MTPPYPFHLDPFQEEALAALERGASVLVAAPTGVGKTVIAEMAIDGALGRGERALYTSPIKALSNQKFRDFCERYGRDRVGIVTGDVQVNPAAPLLILTTEILHNWLLCGDLARVRKVSSIVFDEFHYLSDPERGPVWEESIMLCPKHIRIVCLSATLPNIHEVADWMRQHVGLLETIVETDRPVPLSYYYFADGDLHPIATGEGVNAPPKGNHGRSRPGVVPLIQALQREDMTPVLYFVFSRKDAEEDAQVAASWLSEHAPLGPEAEDRIATAIGRIDNQTRALPQAQALIGCLQAGAGFHHAGLLPELKELVERLFGDGLLQLLCATETFALGLNMPARTVALARMSKFDGRAHRDLTAREFQQMAGRAGRRGKDDRGHVVVMADPWKPFSSVKQLMFRPLEAVQSAFSFSYNRFLNVSAAYGEPAAESIVSRSFLVHQLEAELAGAETRLRELDGADAGSTRQRASRKQLGELRRRADSIRAACVAGRHRKELDVIRGTLGELGYPGLPEKAALVRGIFDDGALLLAELLDDPRLGAVTMAAADFAEVVGWFAGAARGKPARGSTAKPRATLRRYRQLLEDVTTRVQRAERHGGMLLTQAVVPAYPELINRWCSGDDVTTLCREYRLLEGDVATHVERTRQLLRQIARATAPLSAYADINAIAIRADESLAARGSLGDEEQLQ